MRICDIAQIKNELFVVEKGMIDWELRTQFNFDNASAFSYN